MIWLALTLTFYAAPPTVRYAVTVEDRAWEPIAPAALQPILEGAVLTPLTQRAHLRLQRSSFADLKSGDNTLIIAGRFIEEAEVFSLYLSFGPGRASALPSFEVSETVPVGRRPVPEIQKIIEAMAARASARLGDLLRGATAGGVEAQADEGAALPWSWGAIEIPKIAAPTSLINELIDVRHDDHVRAKAAAELAGHAFDQPAARQALERCLLCDPSPALRTRCARGLAPVARTRAPTQRVFLGAMRREVDDATLAELAEQAQNFTGLSHKETVATWLELVSSEATPAHAASRIAESLAKEGDVGNLDLAVAKCLQQDALAYGKKHACAQWLLPQIPPARRLAVVRRYLERVMAFEQGEANTYEEIEAEVVGRGSTPVTAAAAELFLDVATRRSAGHVRLQALFVAGRHPSPTPELLGRVLSLVGEPRLTVAALRATGEWVKRAPALKPIALAALKRADLAYVGHNPYGDPRRDLATLIARLERGDL